MPFMTQGLNLLHIESRPDSAGKYRFFAELSGNILDPRTENALQQVNATCDYLEVTGCYRQKA